MGDYPYMNLFDSSDDGDFLWQSNIPVVIIPDAPTENAFSLKENMLLHRFLNIALDVQLNNIIAEFPVVSVPHITIISIYTQ